MITWTVKTSFRHQWLSPAEEGPVLVSHDTFGLRPFGRCLLFWSSFCFFVLFHLVSLWTASAEFYIRNRTFQCISNILLALKDDLNYFSIFILDIVFISAQLCSHCTEVIV